MKTMLMQNLGATNKEHYGVLWYFLEWSIVLFSTLKRSNSRISLNEAIQCSLPTSATSGDGSLLKHLFFPLWKTFSTQTSLVFPRPGCLRSLLRCFDIVFQRRVRYFLIALKVILSLSDRYKIFTNDSL